MQRSRMSAEEQELANVVAMAPKLLWDLRENRAFIEAVKAVHNDREVYLRYQLVILSEYDAAKECEGITTPVFLALGRYDYVAPHVLWERRRKALPNMSYHLFSRSGHFPMFEEQELFDEKLVEWARD
jgi:proline iminopeptidase